MSVWNNVLTVVLWKEMEKGGDQREKKWCGWKRVGHVNKDTKFRVPLIDGSEQRGL